MNTYRITGTDRDKNSNGEMQPFYVVVKAISPKAAMDKNCKARYEAGRDHILHKTIALKQGRAWVKIPMMEALGLE